MRIRNTWRLTDHGNRKARENIVKILEAGLTASDPYAHTKTLVRIADGKLYVGGRDYEARDEPHSGTEVMELSEINRIFIFGAGKGIQSAVKALEEVLGDYLTDGHIILKYGDEAELKKVSVTHGAHPIPDENCVLGCQKMVEKIKKYNLLPDDVVFTVVGNGISSLLTLPPKNISLDAVKEVTRVLQIEKGMITRSLSNVRNAVDQLKGGRITRMLCPARMFHILTIDCNGSTMIPGYEGLVAGNTWLHTLPVVTTVERALQVIRQHDAENSLPPEIMEYMKNMTPAQDCLRREEFEKMNFRIFGVMPEHLTHLPSAVAVAKELGYATHVISKGWFMEAREMGKFIAHMAKLIHAEEEPFTPPCALFAIGEMVVTVGKGSGVGGRNQELVIAAAKEIAGCDRIVIGSVDTDGTDGPGGGFDDEATSQGVSALAGGIVDGYSAEEAARLEYELVDVLKSHGTSKPLWDMGDGIWTTQSISVQDLTVVLVESK